MKEKKKRQWKITGVVLTLLIIVAIAAIVLNMSGGSSELSGQGGPGGQSGPGGQGNQSAPQKQGPTSGQDDTMNKNEDTVYAVKTETVSPSDMKNYIKLNGDIITSTSVDIYPDTSGKLSKLYVSLGDFVKKGQTIAEIDPSLPGQVFSTSPVHSTITGTIIDLPYRVGSTLSSTQIPLASVGDLTDLQVQVYVSERDIATIKTGLNALITFDPYPGIVFNATTTEISPVLNKSSRTMEVKLSIREKDNRIKSGMFASVKLITEVLQEVLSISTVCLVESANQSYVYLIDEEGKAHKQIVETGLRIDGSVEIVTGLSSGDIVVNRGQGMIQDGSTVRISK